MQDHNCSSEASSRCVQRLHRDLVSFQRSNNPQIDVCPSECNMLEWHFIFHALPAETPYHLGCYHGIICFSPEHPLKPPSIRMVTPSGRLHVHRRLCLSMTDFHPESWNPAWSAEAILMGLLSFFLSSTEVGIGVIFASDEERQKLAADSWTVNANNAEFVKLFPNFASVPQWVNRASGGGLHHAEDNAGTHAQQLFPAEGSAGTDEQGFADAEPKMEDNPRLADNSLSMSAATATAASSNNSKSVGMSKAEEEPAECWICRDASVAEELVNPCACRGTQTGVHASCLENWIKHNRQSSWTVSPPECPICKQTLCVHEVIPGIGQYVFALLRNVLVIFVQSLACVSYIKAVQTLQRPCTSHVQAFAVVAIIVFIVMASCNVLSMWISVPIADAWFNFQPQQRPHAPLLQRLYIASERRLGKLIGSFAFCLWVLLLARLPWYTSYPFLVAFLLAVWKSIGQPIVASARSVSFKQILIALFLTALVAAGAYFFRHLHVYHSALRWTNRIALVIAFLLLLWYSKHYLNAGPHLLVGLLLLAILSGESKGKIPLTVAKALIALVLSVHIFLCILCILEIACLRRLRWRQDFAWVVLLQVALLILARTARDGDALLVTAVSLWLLTLSALVFAIFWEHIVLHARRWQQRHSVLRLQVPLMTEA